MMPYRISLTGALTMVLVLVLGRPAWAHAELERSTPGYGDVLTAAPRARLTFSEPMELTGARLSLSDGRNRARALARPVFESPDHRTVAVALPGIPPGTYTLTWFFLGRDGHVMGGEVAFRLAGPTPDRGAAEPRFGAVALAAASGACCGPDWPARSWPRCSPSGSPPPACGASPPSTPSALRCSAA
jgi:methionine-rich copper-binding protein CopC